MTFSIAAVFVRMRCCVVNFLGVMIPLTFHLISVFLRAFGFLECHSQTEILPAD